MGRDLIGLKKKSRLRGALPEAGRKDGQGKGGTLAVHRIAEMGTKSRRFRCLLALSLFVFPSNAVAWSGRAAWWKFATNLSGARWATFTSSSSN